jgi:hypothetical protein
MYPSGNHAIPDEINAGFCCINLDLTRQQEAIAVCCANLLRQGCAFLQLTEKTGIMRITADMTRTPNWIEPRDITGRFSKTMKSVPQRCWTINSIPRNMMERARFLDRLKLSNITALPSSPLKMRIPNSALPLSYAQNRHHLFFMGSYSNSQKQLPRSLTFF